MNLLHLKYAVEVAKAASVTRAAENLYMSQPNLSRAIQELENSLDVVIFKRTSKGIYPTPEGEEFLENARQILRQVDAMEKKYLAERIPGQRFSISVPRASYISGAFTEFAKKLDTSQKVDIYYRETNSQQAVENILEENYHLGILRYQSRHERYFRRMFKEKGLAATRLWEFRYLLLMSEKHPLAAKPKILFSDLEPFIEIAHADSYVPSLSANEVKKAELSDGVSRHIFVYERASQMELLSELGDVFMWVSPIPASMLKRFHLVQRECREQLNSYVDMLIYRKGYRFSELDKMFLKELARAVENLTIYSRKGD